MADKKEKRASGGKSIFDRLTDSSQYTGTHKHRFDDDGKGRGAAGRDTAAKGRGAGGRGNSARGPTVRNIGDILRPDEPAPAPAAKPSSRRASQGEGKPKPKPKPKRASGGAAGAAEKPKAKPKRASGGQAKGKEPNIFDRLTDSSQYTGAHKHRFDRDGKGRGLAGRDSTSKTGASGRHRAGQPVSDLSQITRSNLG